MKQTFKLLGASLRHYREAFHESLAEVSGALEIDVDILSNIEKGAQRPNEDTLALLINHFKVKENEAEKLWELAGYDQPTEANRSEVHNTMPAFGYMMPIDQRIVYTDMVHVMVNNYGVIMNFMQGGGNSRQPLAVARVGMSREHALSVLEVLKKTLEKEVRLLPAPKNDAEKDRKIE